MVSHRGFPRWLIVVRPAGSLTRSERPESPLPSFGTTIVDVSCREIGSSTPMRRLLRTFRLVRGLPETDVCREWYGDLEIDEDRFSCLAVGIPVISIDCERKRAGRQL